jgi:hypothetical protein
MQNPFSLPGRSFFVPSPEARLSTVARTLYAPEIQLNDLASTRIVLSNDSLSDNNARIRVFDTKGRSIPVRWTGSDPQPDLAVPMPPFITRCVEIDGSDYPAASTAWAQIEMEKSGLTGFTISTIRGRTATVVHRHGALAEGASRIVRLAFDAEGDRLSHYTVVNCCAGTETGDVREFALRVFRANHSHCQGMVFPLRPFEGKSVMPDLEKLRGFCGLSEIEAIDGNSGFFATGFWFDPDGTTGDLPQLPSER